ncbi:hypothetical protein [Chondrinema litorale]|uniref:hypothetical protein n=1 Tax=Chondrinema litorale TaxID=2994555 RepID=UPI002542A0EB|nr:hypothetical protein [Chondrinema litorale]UZR97347.1 hypothetical protein OQ292_25945 [Chondrinema litorale]
MKKLYSKFILVILIISVIISCTNERNNLKFQKVEEHGLSLLGRMITFPESLKRLTRMNGEEGKAIPEEASNKSKKIVSIIDSSCSSCVLELEKWSKYVKDKQTISFIFIIISDDNFELFKYFYLDTDFEVPQNIPVYLDYDKNFLSQNKLEYEYCNTFMLDEFNNVILLGSPTSNSEINQLYNKMIIKNVNF